MLPSLQTQVNSNPVECVKRATPASPLSPFSPSSPISPAEQQIKRSAFEYGPAQLVQHAPAHVMGVPDGVPSIAMVTVSNSSNEPTTISSKTTSHSHAGGSVKDKAGAKASGSTPKAGGRRSRRSSFQLKDSIEYDLKEGAKAAQVAEEQLLRARGYEKIDEIAVTLQGSIARFYQGAEAQGAERPVVVIKTTSKELHKKGIVERDGVTLSVKEDIIKEKNLNMVLSKRSAPPEFVRYLDFFEDAQKYYLVSEFGGSDLFQWVVVNHQRISDGVLSLKRWRDHVRVCFSQMCRLVAWLHLQNRVCHLDISLENSLIEGARYDPAAQAINKDDCQVRFCDFGVAEMFLGDSFDCKKFVGKKGYKAPEVVVRTRFDACKADIWSLGVVLFCMLIGAPPFKVAHSSDDNFAAVIGGKLKYLISEYGRLKYMSKFAFDLLTKIFVYEPHRITIAQILEHPYVKDVLLAKEQRQMHRAHEHLLHKLHSQQSPRAAATAPSAPAPASAPSKPLAARKQRSKLRLKMNKAA